MTAHPFEQQLLDALTDIPELSLSGFDVRPGLTGAGVTVLKGRSYYGAWRAGTGSSLVWTYANSGDTNYFAASVEDAVRHTMMMVLRSLQANSSLRTVLPMSIEASR